MPHKPAICVYCQKPMSIERVHPSVTPYHGECRIVHLRHLWKSADEARKARILDEVRCIESSRQPPT